MVKDLDSLSRFRPFERINEEDRARFVRYLDEEVIPFLPDLKRHYEKHSRKYMGLKEEKTVLNDRFKQNPLGYEVSFFHVDLYNRNILDDFRIRYHLGLAKYDYCWWLLRMYDNFRMMSGLYKEILKPHRTDQELKPLISKFDRLIVENKDIQLTKINILMNHCRELQVAYLNNLKKFQSVQVNHIKDKSSLGKLKNSIKLLKLQIKSRIH